MINPKKVTRKDMTFTKGITLKVYLEIFLLLSDALWKTRKL